MEVHKIVPNRRAQGPSISRAASASKQRSISYERVIPRVTKKQETLNSKLLEEYGSDINEYLKQIERKTQMSEFLLNHEISEGYRAKMIDWMVEVLTTFKCHDQTFFLAVNLMDRYFKDTQKQLKGSELHLVGIISMFVASKYEDVIPLLMKTVINKIGHNKFDIPTIEQKEIELL